MDDRTDTNPRYPVGFADWEPHQQRDWVRRNHSRAGLIRVCLSLANVEVSRPIGKDTRLTKEELAGLLLALERQ